MKLLVMRVHGDVWMLECDNDFVAEEMIRRWLRRARKNYPNAKFISNIYEVTEKKEVIHEVPIRPLGQSTQSDPSVP